MVTESEKTILRETWETAKSAKSLNDLGIEMFVSLFAKNPELQPMFPFADEDTPEKLRNSKRVARHGLNVMKKVDLVIGSLDDMDAVNTALNNLGEKHQKYKATKAHFGPVGGALVSALAIALGDKWTPEVQSAWTNIFQVIVVAMGQHLP